MEEHHVTIICFWLKCLKLLTYNFSILAYYYSFVIGSKTAVKRDHIH